MIRSFVNISATKKQAGHLLKIKEINYKVFQGISVKNIAPRFLYCLNYIFPDQHWIGSHDIVTSYVRLQSIIH
ncbi:hypothetical protein [Sphingobacterium multivorum]|uniref:hypothetical protein n=1 Tax=Sphingobacterium multivorum TaxID=28454 RepID=UPI0028AC406D|nr:hypothetical protein [Sphingobacterium multivorum]